MSLLLFMTVASGIALGADTSLGNNLSVPVILSEGIGITGEASSVNTGFRGVAGVPYLIGPYQEDATVAYFLQNTASTWQASVANGTTPVPTMIDWGDNLVRQTWNANSHIRVEVALTTPVTGMTGYQIASLGGTGNGELLALVADRQGTNYTARTFVATSANVLSPLARLTIHKITGPGGNVVGTGALLDSALWQGYESTSHGGATAAFGVEVNGAGTVIYAYNWFMGDVDLTKIGLPSTAPKSGWYRLTFSLDGSASWTTSTGAAYSAARNLTIDSLNPADTSEGSGEMFTTVPTAGGGGGGGTGPRTIKPFYPPNLINASTGILELYIEDPNGQRNTKITIPSGQKGQKGSTTTVTASLTDDSDVPLEGKIVVFKTMGAYMGTAITDASGTASLVYLVSQDPGALSISATFVGDENYQPSKYCGTLEVGGQGGNGGEDGGGGGGSGNIDLNLTMSVANQRVEPGSSFAYVLNVKNEGTGRAAHIAINQTLPSTVTVVSMEGDGWSCEHAVQVTCQIEGSLAGGAVLSPLTVTVTAPKKMGSLESTATVTCAQQDSDPSDNTATISPRVDSADLKVNLGVTPKLVAPGGTVTYVVDVQNKNGAGTASDASFSLSYPPAAAFVSAGGDGWTCGQSGSTVNCSRSGNIQGGQGVPQAEIVLTAPAAAATLAASATVTNLIDDADTSDNVAVAVAEVIVSDLGVVISNERNTVNTMAPLVQRIVVRNEGPSATPSATLLYTPPGGLAVVLEGSGWLCSGNSCTLINPLPVGAVAPDVYARTTAPAAATVLQSAVEVSPSFPDPVLANNTASIAVNVVFARATVAGTTTICEGESTQLTAALQGVPPWTAVWSDGVTEVVNGPTASRSVKPGSTTRYWLASASDANGPVETTADATVTINPSPTISISADGPMNFCDGGSVRLTAITSENVRWSTGETGNTILVTQAGRYIAYAMPASGCNASASVEIAILPTPDRPVISGPARVNVGHELVLEASGGFTQYEWYRNGTLVGGATERTYRKTAQLGDSGLYTVLGLGTECSAGMSDSFSVNVMPGSLIIPVAGSTAGANGSRFTTQLQLHSHDGSCDIDKMIFYPNGSGATEVTFPMTIAKNGTKHFHELVSEAGLNGFGSLEIHMNNGEPPIGYARVINDQGGGRGNGFLLPLINASEALAAGDRAVLLAPDDMQRFRYNVGIRSLDNGTTLRLQIRDRDGNMRGSVDRSLGPNEFVQASAQSFLGLEIGAGDSIELNVLAGNVIAYGASTENMTNDSALQMATRVRTASPDTEQITILPAAGTVPKPGGGAFRTALQIHNPGSIAMDGLLEFVGSPAGKGLRRAISFNIAPGATEQVLDIMDHFGDSGLGSLDVHTNGDAQPLVLGRIYWGAPQGGQNGMLEEGVSMDQMLQPGGEAHILGPIDINTARLNIGIRTAEQPAVIRIRTYSEDGSIRSESVRQFPPSYFQQMAVSDLVGHPILANDCFGFKVLEGSALVYGSLVDNLTNDGAIVVPVAIPDNGQ